MSSKGDGKKPPRLILDEADRQYINRNNKDKIMVDNRPTAKNSHQAIFSDLDSIVEKLHQWIDLANIPDDGTALGTVSLAFIFRSFNQYRSILNLLKTNHWEDALILTRSLFELLLHAEELIHRSKDQELAAQHFLLFSQLQDYREWAALERYKVASARNSQEYAKKLDKIDNTARKLFAPFSYTNKKKRKKWRENWCKKKVADLCNLSQNPMRMHQYRILYAKGSDFVHSSPAAVFSATHLDDESNWEKFITHVDSAEKDGLRLVASFSTIFLGELLSLTGNRLPDYDPDWLIGKLSPTVKKIANGW